MSWKDILYLDLFVVEDVTLIFTCIGINTKHVATCTKISAPPCKLLKYYLRYWWGQWRLNREGNRLNNEGISSYTFLCRKIYRRCYNCYIVPPKGKIVLNKNRNPTISKRYVGSLIIVTLRKLLHRKLVLDVRSRYKILTYATHNNNT